MISQQMRMLGLALMFLAKKYFIMRPHDRVPTVQELSKEAGISLGTMQTARDILKKEGAVLTVSKGHLGTYIEKINHKKLLLYLKNSDIVGSLPLPYTKKYEGLATAIYQSFLNSDMPVNLFYMNGSKHRLSGLKEGRSDFIITSGLTANYLVKHNPNLEIYLKLPKGTYVSTHVLIFKKGKKPEIKDGAKIGVDENSIDYVLLTKSILEQHKIHLVPMPYNQIVKNIINGVIDYAIWNKDEIIEQNYPVSYQELSDVATVEASEAAIVGKQNNVFVKTILRKTLSTKHLVLTQNKVISGEVLPVY
ncbi:GntR family transcriptional regulator [Lactobacillus mulieris]|uniref:GntR family transcriptional regulator YhfZ n=1 Tax=Lactobacillus TaxID=1578 RepID=UPI00117A3F43|nr:MULTISPECIES: GntR family transcriptional regulator YhfZ [Lactobacillus]KAA9243626.1 GntR family transcriptional regulator [Lactobacillus jensenii]MCW8124285.1 GntR family transcriptional regulator YhfZ [Lactobacillus mulieris]MCZ9599355.1 GntR family transcriptional regulator [Lactobacillus mulieris]MDK7327500.1 GntR family transcriptional regulator YhfZ [Lactobacillus mulieris]TRT38360.1 GntR family transcriptional regulator [Lactobacillus sp. c10Ua232AE]